MKPFFGEISWADRVRDGDNRADFGPYFYNEDQRRLMLPREIRRWRVDHPDAPSPGWTAVAVGEEYEAQAWCPPGGEALLTEGRVRRVIVPEGEERWAPSSADEVRRLVFAGRAFVYEGTVFLLPRNVLGDKTFTYEHVEPEPLTVFVGYRGHVRDFPTILSPSVLRNAGDDEDFPAYLAYKAREGYAGDLLREAYFLYRGDELQDLQVRGILQHHKTIGDTDVLDLTTDAEIAKLFALHDVVDATSTPWTFDAKAWRDGDDFSCVYQVVVRVIGGSREPLPVKFRGREITLLPFNVCPLRMVTEVAQRERGFGVSHLGPRDRDKFGMILNVTEWRYHPETAPHGWDPIGGPPTSPPEELVRSLQEDVLPPEPAWLEALLEEIRRRVERRFGP